MQYEYIVVCVTLTRVATSLKRRVLTVVIYHNIIPALLSVGNNNFSLATQFFRLWGYLARMIAFFIQPSSSKMWFMIGIFFQKLAWAVGVPVAWDSGGWLARILVATISDILYPIFGQSGSSSPYKWLCPSVGGPVTVSFWRGFESSHWV